jgi:vacuolar-type H+-ATPase subunit I/STV1
MKMGNSNMESKIEEIIISKNTPRIKELLNRKNCSECGQDISNRGNRSTKCVECQKKDRYKRKNEARNRKYSERMIVGDNFFIGEDEEIYHISSTQTRKTAELDEQCRAVENIDEMQDWIQQRRGEVREIRHRDIKLAIKVKDWEEVHRLNNEVNVLRREMKIISDWFKHRRDSEGDYWYKKAKAKQDDYKSEGGTITNEDWQESPGE